MTWEVINTVTGEVVCEGCFNSIYRDVLATAVEAGEMTAKEALDQYAAGLAEDAVRHAQRLYLGDQQAGPARRRP